MGEGVSPSLSRNGFPVANHLVVSDSSSCEHVVSVFSTSVSANLPDQGCVGLTTRGHPLKNRVFPPQKGKVVVPYGHRDAASSGARAAKVGCTSPADAIIAQADRQCSVSPSSAPMRSENGVAGARASKFVSVKIDDDIIADADLMGSATTSSATDRSENGVTVFGSFIVLGGGAF